MNRTDGRNQYRCHFCQKMCKPLGTKCPDFSKHARWHMCAECNVFFAVGPCARLHGAKYNMPDPKNEKNSYQMVINYKKKETRINYFEEIIRNYAYGSYNFSNKELLFKNLLTLEKALKDINPKNVYEKIKMYILFS